MCEKDKELEPIYVCQNVRCKKRSFFRELKKIIHDGYYMTGIKGMIVNFICPKCLRIHFSIEGEPQDE